MTIILALNSCISKDVQYLSLPVKEIDYNNNTDPLISGEQMDWNVIGGTDLAIFDTLCMITSNDPSGQLSVINLNTNTLIGKFCIKGRARNDFNQVVSNTEQVYQKNGDIYYPLVNYPNRELKEVNITKSLKEQFTVIESVSDCTMDEFVLLDNDINKRFVNQFVDNTMELKEKQAPTGFFVCQGKKEKEIKVFPRRMRFEDEEQLTTPYSGTLYKHPEKNYAVEVFMGIDYMFFFDLDNKQYFAVHQKGSISYDDIFPDEYDDFFYFTEVAVANDFFFVLYWHGDYSQNLGYENVRPEMLAFDWNGNYLGGIKLKEQITSIEYDKNKNVIYGMSTDESIYCYKNFITQQ